MSSGDWKPGCPNCPCPSCRPEPARVPDRDRWSGEPVAPEVDRWSGAGEQECAYDRISREYRGRGLPMPTSWLLVCNCRRCKPVTF